MNLDMMFCPECGSARLSDVPYRGRLALVCDDCLTLYPLDEEAAWRRENPPNRKEPE